MAADGAEHRVAAQEGKVRGVSAVHPDLEMNVEDISGDLPGIEDAIKGDIVDGHRYLGDITSNLGTGKWYTFYHDPKGGTGGFVQGCSPTTAEACPGAAGVTLPTDVNTPPWTITSSTCTKVTWTETWFEDNKFQLYVNGRLALTGSTPSRGPDCGENPVVCYGAGASKGEFVLPPGHQSITFKIADPYSSDRGAFKVDPYPCPAGNVNYLLDGGWFLFETDYLGNTKPTNSQDPASPWTFYSPCSVDFTVAETFISNNQFSVYDGGALVGRTNVAAQDRCSDGYIDPDAGCLCEGDVDVCIANGAAHGTFRLAAGSHSITVKGYPSLIDYGNFKIDTLCAAPTKAPTLTPTKIPTKPPSRPLTTPPTLTPTKAPTKPPTNPSKPPTTAPSRPPTMAPSSPPTKAPSKRPTNAPSKPPTTIWPTKRPTQPPTTPCPRRETTATFELWDGNTNSRVSAITNTSTVCLRNNWSIRAVTTHERASCGPVRLRFYDPLLPNSVVRRQSETTPPFFLFGDDAATGDVYGNTNVKPRIRGLALANNRRYCIRSVTVSATGYSEQCFTNLCS